METLRIYLVWIVGAAFCAIVLVCQYFWSRPTWPNNASDSDDAVVEHVCPLCGKMAREDVTLGEIDIESDPPTMEVFVSVICPNCGEIANLISTE